MKRLFKWFLFLVLFMTLSTLPVMAIDDIQNITANDSTYTVVRVSGLKSRNNICALQSAAGNSFRIKKSAEATAYWTVKADQGISIPVKREGNLTTVIWVLASVASDTIQVIITEN